MAVEIDILSGARNGERIVLDAEEFRAGADSHCEVFFDPRSDPSAKSRSVSVRLAEDGWFITSTGAGEVLLNQTPIDRETRIRSGDVVRLSERGPDFSFAITSRAAAVAERAAPVSRKTAKRKAGVGSSGHARGEAEGGEATPDAASEMVSRPSRGSVQGRRKRVAWAGAAVAVAALLVVAAWYREHTAQFGGGAESGVAFELEAITVGTTAEGELTLRLRLTTTGALRGQPVFLRIGQPDDAPSVRHPGTREEDSGECGSQRFDLRNDSSQTQPK